MEMKPDDYKKYLAKWGSPVPKSGRYAPHGQHFQCSTQEEIDKCALVGRRRASEAGDEATGLAGVDELLRV